MIELTVPWPPSDNIHKKAGRMTRTKTGQYYQPRVNTDETKHFFWQVWMAIQKKGIKSFGSAMISVEVDAFPPDKRKRDITNILKVLDDALQKGGLFDDDFQIARLVVERCAIVPEGKVIVRVQEYAK